MEDALLARDGFPVGSVAFPRPCRDALTDAEGLLDRKKGARIDELIGATSWLPHPGLQRWPESCTAISRRHRACESPQRPGALTALASGRIRNGSRCRSAAVFYVVAS